MLAPANSTSVRNNPFGPVTYGAPRPVGVGGLGAVVYNAGKPVMSYSIADQPGENSGGIHGLRRGLGNPALLLAATNPYLGAVAAGLSIAQLISSFTQPSQTGIFKQDATTVVNGLEVELKAVDQALRSNPTCENKAAAINFFWTVWGQVVNACSQFGGPGTACVNDRAPGGKVSWFNYYLNPWTDLQCTEPTSASSNATAPATAAGTPTNQPATPVSQMFSGNSLLVLGALALGLFAMHSMSES